MTMTSSLIKDLEKLKNLEKAKVLQRFFKTGKGQYAEGDIFWGITVPQQRKVAQKFAPKILTNLPDLKNLIASPIHEIRLTSLLSMVYAYKKATEKQKGIIFNLYFSQRKYINNWDLVDVTTPNIIGDYILNNPERQKEIFNLISSNNLWERRISILACFPFIKNNDFKQILKIGKQVLNDRHDLIHKASGWMLREVGKRNEQILKDFLYLNATKMPRTMLRYTIEKFPEDIRLEFLKMK
ncbi:MAG: DNA alkylation repair protein [Candidatus Pacebacteria bacterium CG10_big_fil_rev_8_21_14_0_10_36_11]|nr:DNA alkylation repair protein [Candidatus Pacearchaeota archaeon]OIP74151.1 MAG: hypothetical protein AUK08_02780 [Candidatus Pacebacteria bacterium CG2_30_36_39]PIR65054.1 MAG: DNA alkylation repair protein [Candidatus Pacebacteria bacterium CG10_big_fil_rev_8_21_14_0_10_36_11]PJC42724.1 MAG: DNA alkylation repair protein [Candidatus Pacebacteria bacterium CG_4_9_14_0_2_um_filter_36_8]